ncbi:hypothetical protein BDQ17DRAFT_1333196 [Cyathus striatus]|nr:hypothetical protein BDQ17DRAFT_1333196 [Cyathus striatus]
MGLSGVLVLGLNILLLLTMSLYENAFRLLGLINSYEYFLWACGRRPVLQRSASDEAGSTHLRVRTQYGIRGGIVTRRQTVYWGPWWLNAWVFLLIGFLYCRCAWTVSLYEHALERLGMIKSYEDSHRQQRTAKESYLYPKIRRELFDSSSAITKHDLFTSSRVKMTLDKEPLPDDPTPSDGPPSYDTITSSRGASGRQSIDPISKISTPTPALSHHQDSSASSPGPNPTSPPLLKSPSSHSPSTSKPQTSWFSFLTSSIANDVRLTILGLVRDLVQEHDPDSSAVIGILQSCANVSSTHGVSLSAVLQEKSIEDHTPFYWAIVKRTPDASEGIPDLLSSLLLFSTPLKPSTISDIRRACLVASDQPLFHSLRQLREFNAVSPADEMLLGPGAPPDEVEVVDEPREEVTFAVRLGIWRFQKRMMVAGRIEFEFIARGVFLLLLCNVCRMWKLEFFIVPPPSSFTLHEFFTSHPPSSSTVHRVGSWCISLSLIENSPPTWVDSRLLIPEPPPSPSLSSQSSSFSENGKQFRPTISIRLKSYKALTPCFSWSDGGMGDLGKVTEPMFQNLTYTSYQAALNRITVQMGNSNMGSWRYATRIVTVIFVTKKYSHVTKPKLRQRLIPMAEPPNTLLDIESLEPSARELLEAQLKAAL